MKSPNLVKKISLYKVKNSKLRHYSVVRDFRSRRFSQIHPPIDLDVDE